MQRNASESKPSERSVRVVHYSPKRACAGHERRGIEIRNRKLTLMDLHNVSLSALSFKPFNTKALSSSMPEIQLICVVGVTVTENSKRREREKLATQSAARLFGPENGVPSFGLTCRRKAYTTDSRSSIYRCESTFNPRRVCW
jgi:hypothetical protein